MAKYAPIADVCLVTCTDGELGEIAEVPGLGPEEDIRPQLGQVRREELRRACEALGVRDVRLLGYRDSGMAGTADNEAPESFINQDLEGVVMRLVEIVRSVRPHVVVTYNDLGFYGHPDHIRAHQAAMASFARAADHAFAPQAGDAWPASKLYYVAVTRSGMLSTRDRLLAAGAAADEVWSDEVIDQVATRDDDVTAAIDVSAYLPHKLDALRAHRTQYGTTRMFLEMPQDIRDAMLQTEYYTLALSRVPPPEGRESDLFERVPL